MTEGKAAVRPLRDEDFDDVHALYADVFGAESLELWQRRFSWQFDQNPAAIDRPSQFWVAEAEGAIVGFLASFPMRLSLGDRVVLTSCPCDLMVSGAARGLGLGRALIDAYLATSPPLANALAYSPSAARIYRKLGYREVFAEPVLVRPYAAQELMQFVLDQRGATGVAARLTRRFAVPTLGLFAGLSCKMMNSLLAPRRSSGVSINQITAAGDEFDTLWATLRQDFPAVPVRDRAFVQWRFLDDPLRQHTVLIARGSAGEPLGYLAFMTAARRGVSFGYLMDLFASPTTSRVIESLLGEALRLLEAKRVAAINSLGLHPGIRRTVQKSLYFRPRRMELPAWLRWHGDPSLANLVYDADNWHLAHADGDDAFSL